MMSSPANMDEPRPEHLKTQPTQTQVEKLRQKIRKAERNLQEMKMSVGRDIERQERELSFLRAENGRYKQRVSELLASEATVPHSRISRLSSATTRRSSWEFDLARRPATATVRRNSDLEKKRAAYERLQHEIEGEREKSRGLDKACNEMDAVLRRARRQLGGINAAADAVDAVKKQVQVLESRLDQSLVKFNNVLKENRNLRDEIDTLRGSREVFERIYARLERELQERKRELAFIIEVSNIAYEERDNNQQVLQSLKTFSAEEMSAFDRIFGELDTLMESDRRTREEVQESIAELDRRERTHKLQERLAATSSAAVNGTQGRRGHTGAANATAGDGSLLNSGGFTAAEGRAYEEAFSQLRQATGILDLQQLVNRFTCNEEENFSMFTYISDLTREIRRLEGERADLIAEIDEAADGTDADRVRAGRLKCLERKLHSEEQESKQYTEMTQRITEVLQGIIAVVDDIFTLAHCDGTEIVVKKGVMGLTFDSLLLYLSAIERRATELMTRWCAYEQQLGGSIGKVELLSPARMPLSPAQGTQVIIDTRRLPTTGEEGDFGEHDDYPLSKEELLKRVRRKMNIVAAEKRAVRNAPPLGMSGRT